MFSVTRVALLAVLLLVMTAGASASSGHTLRGNGLTLSLPAGWHGIVGTAGFQVADFPLGSQARNSADVVRVPRGHVHLIVWNYGPWVPYLHFRPTRTPLLLRRRNKTPSLEGFGTEDAYFVRTARLRGEMLEIVADLGPKPLAPGALRKVNAVLTTLRVLPPRVLRLRQGRLAADGVSLHLSDGWSGRIEVPAQHFGARLVLRASRGHVHVGLLEYAESYGSGRPLQLPVVLRSRDLLRRPTRPIARRVFSNGGRRFDLSVTAHSPRDLREANRLLATLKVVPRQWTFRCCNLALRVPGTWRVALKPRVYPVLKLRGPGALVVLSELRPGEHASGRILKQNGRRFHVEVTPSSARARANAVLATLRAQRRS